MMEKKKKAVIFAPFWQQAGHVGNYRVDRFMRWLIEGGFHVVLVRAGSVSEILPQSWGVEIAVKDSRGHFHDAVLDSVPVRINGIQRFSRYLSYWRFNPDQGVVWALEAANNPAVLEGSKDAAFVISSSPPESAHVGAAALAQNIGAELIIDMRDGWVDDPLKPYLRSSKCLLWRESKLENEILDLAYKIFVTSPVWKSLLVERLPFIKDKTVVLTNAYPPRDLFDSKKKSKKLPKKTLNLVYAGRFTGSAQTRHASLLLGALLDGLDTVTSGVITLLGRLEWDDLNEIDIWRPRFENIGWSIEVRNAIPREEMMDLLGQADGLLLLAASQAAIPGKLFEYLVTGKPVFVSTPKGGAVWTIGESLPQLFVSECAKSNRDVVCSFLADCNKNDNDYDIPLQFSEEVLSRVFLDELT